MQSKEAAGDKVHLKSREKFDFKFEAKVNNSITLKKFVSPRTGLTVIIGQVPGPLVSGCLAIGTEAQDDDGMPHCLEHLIFLGSKDFPYKGTLDLAANFCFASGTNAWTDVDHTAYTVYTVGSDGFLALLPIYMDHILYPTLTDEGFVTEVHHITGEGKDAGVVYCEMQGRETLMHIVVESSTVKALYPEGCGYRSETGGVLKNLRESTSIKKIREYHNEYYRPENLSIIIMGTIDEDKLFEVIDKFEEKILSKGSRGPFVKPWQNPVPLLDAPKVLEVQCCNDVEDAGVVNMAWHGPSSVTEHFEVLACIVLMKYLAGNSTSPIVTALVETENQYCSQITSSVTQNSTCCLCFQFENVPIDKIHTIADRAYETIMEVYKGESGGIDVDKMRSTITRYQKKVLSKMEKSPHRFINKLVISNMLYARDDEDTISRLDSVQIFNQLKNMPQKFWTDLLHKYYISRPSVIVYGIPSIAENEKSTQIENERIDKQLETLGPDGLQEKAKILVEALEQNSRPVPYELISNMKLAPLNNIKFHEVRRYDSDYKTKDAVSAFKLLRYAPLYTRGLDIQTQFVHIYTVIDTAHLSRDQRMYLPFMLEYLLKGPIKLPDGQIKSYEDMAKELEKDVLTTRSSLGLKARSRFTCGPYASAFVYYLKVHPENYLKGIKWFRDLLFNISFDVERVIIVASKLINSISQARNGGNILVDNLMKLIWFQKGTNHEVCNLLYQEKFLKELIADINKPEKFQSVRAKLEDVRKCIIEGCCGNNIMVNVAADFDSLYEKYGEEAELFWKEHALPPNVAFHLTEMKAPKIKHDKDWLEPNPTHQSCVVGMASLGSAFLSQVTTNAISDFHNSDLPGLMVFVQYLVQLEGPIWRSVRGMGLTYSYGLTSRPNEKTTNFSLYMSTDVVKAFKTSLDIVNHYMSDECEWNSTLFKTAKSSLVYELVDREKNVDDAIVEDIFSCLMGVKPDFNRDMIEKVNDVKIEDMKRIGRTYIEPLFNPETSKTVIVCHTSKIDSVVEGFAKMGFKLEVYPTIQDSFLSPGFKSDDE